MLKSVKIEVSVLFSEPKIPQSDAAASPDEPPPRRRFSALQRAENSSIPFVEIAAGA